MNYTKSKSEKFASQTPKIYEARHSLYMKIADDLQVDKMIELLQHVVNNDGSDSSISRVRTWLYVNVSK